MNVAVTAGANVAIHAALIRKSVIAHFEKAGALSPETAVGLPPKHPSQTVKALVKQGVLVEAEEGLFYLDPAANERALKGQMKAGGAVVMGLVAVLAFVVAGLLIAGRISG